MAFNIEPNPTFSRTVTVNVPDGAKFRQETMQVQFRALPSEKVNVFDLRLEKATKDFLRAVIVRIDDLVDGKGVTIDYSESVRDQLIDWPFARLALSKTYFDEVSGLVAGN